MEAAALNSTLNWSSLPNDDSIPATIPVASLVTDAMIKVTELVVASPVATQPPLSETQLGLPPTPDSRRHILREILLLFTMIFCNLAKNSQI